MKIPVKYFWWLGVGLLLLMGVEFLKKQEINWTPTYSSFDKIPFGTRAVYDLFNDATGSSVLQNNRSFYELHKIDSSQFSMVYCVDHFAADLESLRSLFQHIENGNSALVSANHYAEWLMDTLGFELFFDMSIEKISSYDLNFKDEKFSIEQIDGLKPNRFYSYFKIGKGDFIYEIIGKREGNPNCIKVKIGQGELILHSDPLAFTNYYVLNEKTNNYCRLLLSELPAGDVYWDDYLINGSRKPASIMRFVLSSAPIRAGYYLLSVTLLLYLLLGGRRMQRVIPVLKAPKNETASYINVLTNLFLSRRSHRKMGQYLVSHFKWKTSRKYYLNWKQSEKEIIVALHLKSGKEQAKIEELFKYFAFVEEKATYGQDELHRLNRAIEEFKL